MVESTALAKASSADAFRLSVTLRNRAPTVAALPWIDLSLTDANGQLVARRALSPQDFRSRTTTMAAGSETSLQAHDVHGHGTRQRATRSKSSTPERPAPAPAAPTTRSLLETPCQP